jgi:hypothetical protein
MSGTTKANADPFLPEEVQSWADDHRLKEYTGRVERFEDRENDDFDTDVLTDAYSLPCVTEASSILLVVEEPRDPLEEICWFHPSYKVIFRNGLKRGIAFFCRPQERFIRQD